MKLCFTISTLTRKRKKIQKEEDTGLFFFRGNPGEKFAVCSAGGGFAYVGAMQDSFPHALGLSERGYNAFALIYRPGAVIMQYTGHSDYTANDPATFACVGESDGIADWRSMRRRINRLKASGIPTEFHHYPGLRHGSAWAPERLRWHIQSGNIVIPGSKNPATSGTISLCSTSPSTKGKWQRSTPWTEKKRYYTSTPGAPESICGDGSSGRRTE